MIRILLADDQALIRSGIWSLLEAEDDTDAIGMDNAPVAVAGYRPDW